MQLKFGLRFLVGGPRQGNELSYGTKKNLTNTFTSMSSSLNVIPLGFEPKTHSLEGCCSIQLSYGTITFASAKIVKAFEKTQI